MISHLLTSFYDIILFQISVLFLVFSPTTKLAKDIVGKIMSEGPLTHNVEDNSLNKDPTTDPSKVHIRVQQRNGRKSITTVQGLGEEIDYPKLLKALKKEFGCNGTILSDASYGTVLQLQGDQRVNLGKFFVEKKILLADEMETHGF